MVTTAAYGRGASGKENKLCKYRHSHNNVFGDVK